MQEVYTSPGVVDVQPGDNAVAALWERAATQPDAVALSYRDGEGFTGVTTRQLVDRVRRMAAGLIALGIQPGDRVALYCSTRIEFTYFDYAIWAAGAAAVTVYETSSAEQVKWIVGDSEAVAIVCESDELEAVFDQVAADLPLCRRSVVIENGAIEELEELASDITLEEVDSRVANITHEDLATLVYTSGTTGRPKGCIISHGNFTWTLRQAEQALPELIYPGQRQLMFLPLAHIFARVVQVACVTAGVEIAFSSGIPQLIEELELVKPTWVFAVPRVFEKIYNSAKQKAEADGKGGIFDSAVQTAIDYSRQREAGRVGLWTGIKHAAFDRLVYGKLRAVFGGELRYAISGGAPLGERLGHFFSGIGLTALEGYGLTETTAVTSVNRVGEVKIGTVGRPVPGVSIGIADDSEVLIAGGNVFAGYWKNEAATEEALDTDGWFHSGDIGELDDGFLRITGRKKELIVTAGGKNVAPSVLEDRLRAHALVSQCMVIGDAQPFIAALITIDEESLPAWAESNEKPEAALGALIDDEELRVVIEAAVADANQVVSRAESIRAWRILPEDLTIEGGELTPTLKVRRDIVSKKYETVIAEIYS